MKLKETVKDGVNRSANYFFKKKLVTSIIVGVIALGVGIGGGILIDKFFIGKSGVDYNQFDVNDYTVDRDKLLMKYETIGKLNDYTTKLKPYEMVNIAFGLYSYEPNTMTISHGEVLAAGQTQFIRNSNIKNGDICVDESISVSGFVKVANRVYQTKENIELRIGTNIEKEKAKWPEEPTSTFTAEEYKEKYGKEPREPLIFIISSKTINESNVSREGTDYIINMKLKKKETVLNYVKQMQTLSDLKSKPTFSRIDIDFTLDKDLMIKKMVSHEAYYAKTKFGVGSDCSGDVIAEYYTGKEFTIPTITQNINYNYDGGNNICEE